MSTEFRSRWSRYVTSVEVENKNITVAFEGMRDGGSYFVTSDQKVSDELKERCRTSNDIYLFNEEGADTQEHPEPKKEVKEFKAIEEVTNITEAREYLRKEGVDYRKLNSPNSVAKQAEELGVKFPNLK